MENDNWYAKIKKDKFGFLVVDVNVCRLNGDRRILDRLDSSWSFVLSDEELKILDDGKTIVVGSSGHWGVEK